MTWSQRHSNIILYTIYITSFILMIICIIIFSYYNSILQTRPHDPSRAHEHYFRDYGCALLSFFVTANAMIVFRVFGINLITTICHAGLQCIVLLYLLIRLATFPLGDKRSSDYWFRIPLYTHVATFVLQTILGFYLMVLRPGSTLCSRQQKSGAHVLLGLCNFLVMFWYITIYLNTSRVNPKHDRRPGDDVYIDELLKLPSIVAVILFFYAFLILLILLLPIFRKRRNAKSHEARDREGSLVPCPQYSPAERGKLIWEDTTALLTTKTNAFQNRPPSTRPGDNATINSVIMGQYCCNQQTIQNSGTAIVLTKEIEELFYKWRPRVARAKTWRPFVSPQRSCGESDTGVNTPGGAPQNLLKSILKSRPQYEPSCCKYNQTQSDDFLEDFPVILTKGSNCLCWRNNQTDDNNAIPPKGVKLVPARATQEQIIDTGQDGNSLSSSSSELTDHELPQVKPIGESSCLKWMKSGHDIGLPLSRHINKATGRESPSRASGYRSAFEMESIDRIKDFFKDPNEDSTLSRENVPGHASLDMKEGEVFGLKEDQSRESPEIWTRCHHMSRGRSLRELERNSKSSYSSEDSVSESDTDCHATKLRAVKFFTRSRSLDTKRSRRYTTENMLADSYQNRLLSGKEESSIQPSEPETYTTSCRRKYIRDSLRKLESKKGETITQENIDAGGLLNAVWGSTRGVKPHKKGTLDRSRSLDLKGSPIYTFANNRSDTYRRRLLSGKEESNINPSKPESHCPRCCCKCSRNTARELKAKKNETSPTTSHKKMKSDENEETGNSVSKAAGIDEAETSAASRSRDSEENIDYKKVTSKIPSQRDTPPGIYCCKCSRGSPGVLGTPEKNEGLVTKNFKNIKIDAIITGNQNTGIYLGGRVYFEMEQVDLTQRGVRNDSPASSTTPSLSENPDAHQRMSNNRLLIKECSCSKTASHTKDCQDICFCKVLPKDGSGSCHTSDEELKCSPVVLKKVCYQTPSQMMNALLNDAQKGTDCSCRAAYTQNITRELMTEKNEANPRRSFENTKIEETGKGFSSFENIEVTNEDHKDEENDLVQIREYNRIETSLRKTSPRNTETSPLYTSENAPSDFYGQLERKKNERSPRRSFENMKIKEAGKDFSSLENIEETNEDNKDEEHILSEIRQYSRMETPYAAGTKPKTSPRNTESNPLHTSENDPADSYEKEQLPSKERTPIMSLDQEAQKQLCCCKCLKGHAKERERKQSETSPRRSFENTKMEEADENFSSLENMEKINENNEDEENISTQIRQYSHMDTAETKPKTSPRNTNSPTLSRQDDLVIDEYGALTKSKEREITGANNEMMPENIEERTQSGQFTRRRFENQIDFQTTQIMGKTRTPTRYPTSFTLDQMPDSKLRRFMNLGPAKPSQRTQEPIVEIKNSVPPCSFLPGTSRNRSRGSDCIRQRTLQCDSQKNFLIRDDPGGYANNATHETCCESPGDRYVRLRRRRSLPAASNVRFFCPHLEQIRRPNSLPRNSRDFC